MPASVGGIVQLGCMEANMQNFVRQQNIKLLQEALKKEVDPGKRRVLEGLLAKEDQKSAKVEEAGPS